MSDSRYNRDLVSARPIDPRFSVPGCRDVEPDVAIELPAHCREHPVGGRLGRALKTRIERNGRRKEGGVSHERANREPHSCRAHSSFGANRQAGRRIGILDGCESTHRPTERGKRPGLMNPEPSSRCTLSSGERSPAARATVHRLRSRHEAPAKRVLPAPTSDATKCRKPQGTSTEPTGQDELWARPRSVVRNFQRVRLPLRSTRTASPWAFDGIDDDE